MRGPKSKSDVREREKTTVKKENTVYKRLAKITDAHKKNSYILPLHSTG